MTQHDIPAPVDHGADAYDRLAPSMWNPMGNAVAAAADILVGERVLDAFAATGAATIPAAQQTGPEGYVDAVDPEEGLIGLARGKAQAMSLRNVRFAVAEPSAWVGADPYDAALSCYPLPRVESLSALAIRIAGLLRPAGRWSLSTWQQDSFEPFEDLLLKACRAGSSEREDPALSTAREHRRIIGSPEGLAGLLEANGFADISVESVPLSVSLDEDLAWSLVCGSAYRKYLPASSTQTLRVRERFLESLGGTYNLTADSLVAVGRAASTMPVR